MVAYRPPDEVLLAIGAAYRTEPILAAATRLHPIASADLNTLAAFGIERFAAEDLTALIDETHRLFTDKRVRNKDTPLQMQQVLELMARSRAWIRTLRLIASINLACDTPALIRISSVAPELAEGHPRTLLEELERVLSAARDLRLRLEDSGLTEAFLGRGTRLAQQLGTALGPKDLDGRDLAMPVRRLYMRKAELYLLLKRLVRSGQLAFMQHAEHRLRYHLDELEPPTLELAGSKRST